MSPRPSISVFVDSRAIVRSRSSAESFPFSTNFARLLSIDLRARSSIGCATSISRTVKPACANTWAMPLPIVPAPITPTVLIIVVLGASLIVLEASLIVLGASPIVLAASLIVLGASLIVLGASLIVLGASLIVLGASLIVLGASLIV